MPWFDAINHAMSAIGTGGFSVKNNSIGFYNSFSIEFAVMIFMMAGALPMTFYILLLRHAEADKNRQVRVFCKLILIYALGLGMFLYIFSGNDLWSALRQSFFVVIAIVTTTGLSTVDYVSWGAWSTAVILFLSLMGGCTGSTCGSIKIFRWQAIYASLKRYFMLAVEPNRVIPLKIGTANMSEKVTMSVFVYVFSFIVSIMILTLFVSLCGIDFKTSIAAVMACITNVGVGSVEVIGPQGNYAFFPDSVKYLLCFAMLLGRLEIITIFVVFSKSFWRG